MSGIRIFSGILGVSLLITVGMLLHLTITEEVLLSNKETAFVIIYSICALFIAFVFIHACIKNRFPIIKN